MKISFDITYDANKLKKAIPKMIREYLNDSIISLEKGSKGAIMKGKFEPLGKFTKIAREQGLSPNSGNKESSSKKPLKYTGELFRSIKARKRDKSIEFNKYGIYHLGADENLDVTLDSFKSTAGKGSGTAYKVASNSFSKKYGIVNKSVPIRDWLQFDKNIHKIANEFYKKLDKNFAK